MVGLLCYLLSPLFLFLFFFDVFRVIFERYKYKYTMENVKENEG